MSRKSSRCGVADMKKTIADRITNTMNEKVYPYMKFITFPKRKWIQTLLHSHKQL